MTVEIVYNMQMPGAGPGNVDGFSHLNVDGNELTY